MQVYMLTWEGQQGQPDCFRNYQDIKPSIQISYCTCQNVQITETPTRGPVKFTITGERQGQAFEETILATRYPVYDSPTHL